MPGLADSSNLTYKCQTTQLPGGSIDPVKMDLHGVSLNFAGRATYTHTLNATFVESSDYATRSAFVNWREMIRSWVKNTGSVAAVYKIRAQISVYNDIPNVVRTTNIFGVWPSQINEVALDGSQSEIVRLEVTFTFDYWEDV